VLDTVTEKDFQEAFHKWRRRWDQCLHAGGNYFNGDGPYGEFYDLYSISPEYFEYHHVCTYIHTFLFWQPEYDMMKKPKHVAV
jgi:hypothetical protein